MRWLRYSLLKWGANIFINIRSFIFLFNLHTTPQALLFCHQSLLLIISPLYRGQQWETAKLFLCLRWAACANVCGTNRGWRPPFMKKVYQVGTSNCVSKDQRDKIKVPYPLVKGLISNKFISKKGKADFMIREISFSNTDFEKHGLSSPGYVWDLPCGKTHYKKNSYIRIP